MRGPGPPLNGQPVPPRSCSCRYPTIGAFKNKTALRFSDCKPHIILPQHENFYWRETRSRMNVNPPCVPLIAAFRTNPILPAWCFALILLVGMMLLFEVGYRMKKQRHAEDHKEPSGLGAMEGAIFALFGLLLAFTFSGAIERFDAHRALIAEEANAIDIAYHRVQLLPEASRPEMDQLFRNYLDARLEVFQKLPDLQASDAARVRAKGLQEEIWSRSVAASVQSGAHPDAGKLLLPALNQMIDITTTREMAAELHPPGIIYILLLVLGLGCSLLAGYGVAGTRTWLHIVGFAILTVITVFVILDVEFPRRGLIRADAYDQILLELRGEMK
jgi:hypothetical protein